MLGTLQTEHSQRSISKSPSLYPTYDPATYEGKSDMEIFKAHVDWVAEFLDIPEFKRFDVRRRTGLISFQPLDGKFKDINYDIFQSLLKFICDELVNYKGPKPTTLELLKRRIRKYFTEFVQRHPDMTTNSKPHT